MHQLTVDAEVAGIRPAFKIPTWMRGTLNPTPSGRAIGS